MFQGLLLSTIARMWWHKVNGINGFITAVGQILLRSRDMMKIHKSLFYVDQKVESQNFFTFQFSLSFLKTGNCLKFWFGVWGWIHFRRCHSVITHQLHLFLWRRGHLAVPLQSVVGVNKDHILCVVFRPEPMYWLSNLDLSIIQSCIRHNNKNTFNETDLWIFYYFFANWQCEDAQNKLQNKWHYQWS